MTLMYAIFVLVRDLYALRVTNTLYFKFLVHFNYHSYMSTMLEFRANKWGGVYCTSIHVFLLYVTFLLLKLLYRITFVTNSVRSSQLCPALMLIIREFFSTLWIVPVTAFGLLVSGGEKVLLGPIGPRWRHIKGRTTT